MTRDAGPPSGGGWPADVGAAALAQEAALGDAAALARLVPVLYRAGGRYLRARLRNADPGDVEDLASVAVVRAVERLHTVRGKSDGEFFAWFRTLAWRVALDAARHRRRRDASVGAVRLDGTGPVSRVGPPPTHADNAAAAAFAAGRAGGDAGGREGWEEAWEDATPVLRLARLAAAAQRDLPPGSVVVLWARLVARDAWTEVAAQVGTTPAGAKRRYQRALGLLRRAVWDAAFQLPGPDRARAIAWLRAVDPGFPARGDSR